MKFLVFIANWIMILSLPLWGGTLVLISFSLEVYRSYKYQIGYGHIKQIIKGEKWLWKA